MANGDRVIMDEVLVIVCEFTEVIVNMMTFSEIKREIPQVAPCKNVCALSTS